MARSAPAWTSKLPALDKAIGVRGSVAGPFRARRTPLGSFWKLDFGAKTRGVPWRWPIPHRTTLAVVHVQGEAVPVRQKGAAGKPSGWREGSGSSAWCRIPCPRSTPLRNHCRQQPVRPSGEKRTIGAMFMVRTDIAAWPRHEADNVQGMTELARGHLKQIKLLLLLAPQPKHRAVGRKTPFRCKRCAGVASPALISPTFLSRGDADHLPTLFFSPRGSLARYMPSGLTTAVPGMAGQTIRSSSSFAVVMSPLP